MTKKKATRKELVKALRNAIGMCESVGSDDAETMRAWKRHLRALRAIVADEPKSAVRKQ